MHIIDIDTHNKMQAVDITDRISRIVLDSKVKDGVCYVYVPHTTSAVTINENADPSVMSDIITGFENIVPYKNNYTHIEGNSPAHIKTLLTGNSVTVLVNSGILALGTWQGIYFMEFDGPRKRKIYVKIIEG